VQGTAAKSLTHSFTLKGDFLSCVLFGLYDNYIDGEDSED
jgi:hypothetical protein